MIDFFLELDDDNNYDIELDANGDAKQTSGLDTSIRLSLLTDQRADASEVSNPIKRRGFIGDELFEDFRHGSKLWLLDQARINSNTRNLAVNYSRLGLQWMIDDGFATDIVVTGQLRPSGVTLEMTAFYPNSSEQSYVFDFWDNTITDK